MAIAGRLSTIEFSEDGNTFVNLGGIIDITYNLNVDELETTSHDSNGARQYIPGFEDQTLDVSCRWVEEDVGQRIILNAAKNKTLFYYRFKMQSVTSRTFVGRAFPTSLTLSGALDDVAGADFTLRCTVLDDPAPALDLDFAGTLSLTDQATGANLVTFTRATSGTYVGSDGLIKTAVAGQPRFDHHPTTGQSLGLLIEEQRTNLIESSEQGWVASNATIQENISVSPSGTLTADRVTSTGAGVFKTASNSSGETVTCSAFVKYVSGASSLYGFGIEFLGGVYVSARVNFDFSTGTVTGVTGLVDNYSVTRYANDWFRVSVTATATATGNTIFTSYATSGAVFDIWGGQIEVGAFPTSYIPTTGSAVTRNVDIVQITGANLTGFYNQNEGTFAVSHRREWNATVVDYENPYIFSPHNQSTGDTINYFDSSGNDIARFESYSPAPPSQTLIDFSTASTAGQRIEFAGSYSSGGLAASRNGELLVNSSATILPNADVFQIGGWRLFYTTTYIHNGTIKRLTYYNTRLNNAIIQGLTSR